MRIEDIWPEAYDTRPHAKRWWSDVKSRLAYGRAEFGFYDEFAERDSQ